ncbi:unnamed protein product, partial [Heterosigma akashiwo]
MSVHQLHCWWKQLEELHAWPLLQITILMRGPGRGCRRCWTR